MIRRCAIPTQTFRSFATKMTPSERNAVLKDANEKMRQYYVNRPSIEVFNAAKKNRTNNREGQHMIQLAAGT